MKTKKKMQQELQSELSVFRQNRECLSQILEIIQTKEESKSKT